MQRYAIVGLACRLPGHSNTPLEFFHNLLIGRDCIAEIPPERFAAGYYNRLHEAHPARVVSHRAGLMDHFFDFDNKAFQISKKEALVQDPQQRILLETSLEALEDSNVPYLGSNMGVFVGSCATGVVKHNIEHPHHVNEYTATGTALSIHANLLSYKFDLRGPSTHLDTACSASGYAMFAALSSMDGGHCDSALVAGCNIMLDHCMMIAFGRLGILNVDGRCKSFDASADGFVRSEGCGVVIVKPLKSALRDGNKIYCVVRACTANADGGLSQSLTTPSAEAQSLSLRRALDRAEVDPSDVFFLEAHATGTKVGDPIEVNGSGSVLGSCRKASASMLRVGSVKSNIGHTECSAYISSLIKCCLMLRYGCLVPNINFADPNPAIKFDEYHMKIQLEVEEFNPEGKFMVVSSFGFGGANTCTILEGVRKSHDVVMSRRLSAMSGKSEEEEEGEGEGEIEIREVTAVDPTSMVLHAPLCYFVYARSKDGLEPRLNQYREFSARFVGDEPEAQAQFAYSLNTANQVHYSHFCWVLGDSFHHEKARVSDPIRLDDVRFSAPPVAVGDSDPPEQIPLPPGHHQHVVLIFSGQGPQTLDMGRGLYQRFRVFRDTIDRCDAAYRDMSGISLTNDLGLFKGEDAKISKEVLDRIENTLPALVFIHLALLELWRSFGVVPSAVIGHSFGELAGSYACGACGSLDTVLRIAYSRVQIVSQMQAVGKMMAIGAGRGEADEMIREMGLEGKVWVAANNSPSSVALGGEPEAILQMHAELTRRQMFARILDIGNAFHTPLIRDVVDIALRLFGETVSDVGAPDPKIPLISTTYGGKLWRTKLTAEYFWDNIQNSVCFLEALDTAERVFGPDVVFLEVAPHPILGRYLRQCGKKNRLCSLNRLFLREKEQQSLIENVASFATIVGPLTVNWRNVFLQGEGRDTFEFRRFWDLPSYPFDRQRLFFENEQYQRSRLVNDRERMPPMIGRLQHCAEETWLAHISLRTHPWIKGHVVQSAVVMPAACYVEMLLECLYDEFPPEGCVLEDIDFVTSMTVPDDEFKYALVQTTRKGEEAFVHSKADGALDRWILQSNGKRGVMPISSWFGNLESPDDLKARLTHRHFDHKGVYERLAEGRLFYGEEFALVEELWQGDEEAFLVVNTENGVDLANFLIHPTFLDVSFHGSIGTIRTVYETFIPDSVRRLVLRATAEAFLPRVNIYTQLLEKDDKHFRGSVVVFDDQMRVLLEVEDLVCSILAELPRHPKLHIVPRFQSHALPKLEICAPPYESHPHWQKVLEMQDHVNHHIIVTLQEGLERLEPFVEELSFERMRYREIAQQIVRLHRPPKKPVSLRSLEGFELEAELIKRVQDNWFALQRNLNNEVRTIMFKDDLLERFYAEALTTRPTINLFAEVLYRTVGDLIRTEPCGRVVRILELGSGTGAVARTVFPLLKEFSGFVEYYYTDISSGFFTDSLKRQFKDFPFVRFIQIDASKPLGPQGIRDSSIDIAIAYDCLHAISHVDVAVRNCQRCLVPNGLLMLVEITNLPSFYNFVFGIFDAWVSFMDDRTHCCLSRDRWRQLLRRSKISVEKCIGDRRDVHSIMVGRKTGFLPSARPLLPKDCFVFRGETDGYVLIDEIQKLDGEWKGDASKSVVVLTVDALVDPAYAGVFGVGLTLLNEYPDWRIRILDVPHSMPPDDVEEVLEVALLHPDSFDPVTVYRVNEDSDGYHPEVLRYLRTDRVLPDERPLSPDLPYRYLCINRNEKRFVRLEDGSVQERERIPAGQIGAEYRQKAIPPLTADQVVVSVRCAALNFKDILLATSHLENFERVLGTDFSGVVVDVGPLVTRFAIGDEVFGLGKHAFGNFLLGREVHMVKKPLCLSFEEAASIPTAYMTAYFALIDRANVQRGDRILVHSCSGGLGQAATQLGLWRGAEVIGTVGTESKREYMRKKYGMEHFGDSHSSSWHEELRQSCHGDTRFVDVVLNCLKGNNIERGMGILRYGGRFVEVGKLDSMANTKVGLRPFLKNIGVFSFHLDEMGFQSSVESKLTRALVHLADLFKKGSLSPSVEHVFTADKIEDAISLIQRRQHLGKVVIRFDTLDVPQILPSTELFSPQKTYILSGGLGAVGFKMTRWMVLSAGAHSVVLLSRSGRMTKYQRRRLQEMNSLPGVRVEVVRCDVTDSDAVRRMYQSLKVRHFLPVGGIFHLAMVLRDGKIAGMSKEDYDVVFKTKSAGAVNLVSPFQAGDLDFVVLFSSIASILCNPDQANYVAGNFFCETYARSLRQRGFRAHCINVGAVNDCGIVAEDVLVRKIMRQKKVMADAMTGKQVFAAIEQMLIGDPDLVQHCPVFGFGGIVTAFPKLAPMISHLVEFKDEELEVHEGGDVKLSFDTLNAVIKRLLMREEDIDADERLTNYGVDSLQSVELASILEDNFGYTGVDQMDILSGITINQLLEIRGSGSGKEE